ncbi:hypothetical protein PQX77_002110 [Marasmius sp. AFHP31]|nr:hypothetical protein PQX77_002110 [Marasmius sp. AFHP31]
MKLIEEEAVPSTLASEHGKSRGGITVKGWSPGVAMTAIAPFANSGNVDNATYLVLEKEVEDLILYGTFIPPFCLCFTTNMTILWIQILRATLLTYQYP